MAPQRSGAIASNADFLDYHKKAHEGTTKGHLFIPKWESQRRWFSNFARVIVRWPYIKDHAMVIYDPQDGRLRNEILSLKGHCSGMLRYC